MVPKGQFPPPQLMTLPFRSSARLWKLPAAMATAFVTEDGTSVCFRLLSPQASTVPPFSKARL